MVLASPAVSTDEEGRAVGRGGAVQRWALAVEFTSRWSGGWSEKAAAAPVRGEEVRILPTISREEVDVLQGEQRYG